MRGAACWKLFTLRSLHSRSAAADARGLRNMIQPTELSASCFHRVYSAMMAETIVRECDTTNLILSIAKARRLCLFGHTA